MGLTKRKSKRPGGHKTEIVMIWRKLGHYETMGMWVFEREGEREESGLGE